MAGKATIIDEYNTHYYIASMEGKATIIDEYNTDYYIASTKFWQGKTLANAVTSENWQGHLNKCTIALMFNIFLIWRIWIWLGEILANDIRFAKFIKVFPLLYVIWY